MTEALRRPELESLAREAEQCASYLDGIGSRLLRKL